MDDIKAFYYLTELYFKCKARQKSKSNPDLTQKTNNPLDLKENFNQKGNFDLIEQIQKLTKEVQNLEINYKKLKVDKESILKDIENGKKELQLVVDNLEVEKDKNLNLKTEIDNLINMGFLGKIEKFNDFIKNYPKYSENLNLILDYDTFRNVFSKTNNREMFRERLSKFFSLIYFQFDSETVWSCMEYYTDSDKVSTESFLDSILYVSLSFNSGLSYN